ncbi:MAG: hypothetical protein KF899_07420 [Parvibaculum sp.]|nr:hypothetical protein [Parvibaculum sp.]
MLLETKLTSRFLRAAATLTVVLIALTVKGCADESWSDAERKNAQYIIFAFEEAQSATRIGNAGAPFAEFSISDLDAMRTHMKNAYKYALLVESGVLDKAHPELREHWTGEMIPGLRLQLMNLDGNDIAAEIAGQRLLDSFGDWWNAHRQEVRIPIERSRDAKFLFQIAVLTLTFGFGIVIVSYASFADARSWPVGAYYRDGASLVMVSGFFSGVVGSPLAALVFLPWWSVVVVVVAGFFTGLVLTFLFRSMVQIVAPLGLVVVWVAAALYAII